MQGAPVSRLAPGKAKAFYPSRAQEADPSTRPCIVVGGDEAGKVWILTPVEGPVTGDLEYEDHVIFDINVKFVDTCKTQTDVRPGVTISTGTEDYYDSAWYFSAGQFALPVSGFTHLNTTAHGEYGEITWSAYRFHEMDPIVWNGNGGRFVWRNGDMTDKHGHKCTLMQGGAMNGHPTASLVESYAWMYTW